MKELSIFVDESGDFGEYDHRAPYYIISMVFHDQSYYISSDLQKLETEMTNIGMPDHCIHVGPIIRQEHEYGNLELEERQKIVKRLMTFVRHIPLQFKSVYIEKKHIDDSIEAVGRLSKELGRFIRNNLEFFFSFDSIKIYYDNGQTEVTKILSSVFNSLLENVEFKKVIPSDYRLFQVADLICTLQLIELKLDKHALSNSEQMFFEKERILKKNYLKPINEKILT